MILVVDASVTVKWYIDEPHSSDASALLAGLDILTAPDFMLLELANVLWKKQRLGELNQADVQLVLDDVQGNIESMIPHLPLVGRAVEIACALQHPVYDCLYLACAEAMEGVFVTADQRLLRQVEGSAFTPFVAPLGGPSSSIH